MLTGNYSVPAPRSRDYFLNSFSDTFWSDFNDMGRFMRLTRNGPVSRFFDADSYFDNYGLASSWRIRHSPLPPRAIERDLMRFEERLPSVGRLSDHDDDSCDSSVVMRTSPRHVLQNHNETTCDPNTPSSPPSTTPRPSSPVPNPSLSPQEILKQRMEEFGFKDKKKIPSDGNCLFAAVSDQLFDDSEKHPCTSPRLACHIFLFSSLDSWKIFLRLLRLIFIR
jgi:hypothetical protein